MSEIDDAIEASSLGTADAKTARDSVSEETARFYIALGRVREAAEEVWPPEHIDTWLHLPQRQLDGLTPRQLVERGDVDRVLGWIDYLADGNFL